MKKTLIISALFAATLNPVFAEEAVSTVNFTFSSVDMNADGFISSEEAIIDEGLTNQFSVLDIDQDGLLSESEFSSFTPISQ